MQPQGSSPSNPDFFQSLTARINAVDTCAELQSLVASAFASLQAEQSAITAQLAALQPIINLIEHPGASPAALASWIGNFIDGFLKPYVGPTLTYVQVIEKRIAEIAALTEAIEAAAARITSCAVSVPALAMAVPLPGTVPTTGTTSATGSSTAGS